MIVLYDLWLILFVVLAVCLIILLIMWPIRIAKSRGITGVTLNAIIMLSWLGIFFGVTWVIALIASLLSEPESQKEKPTDLTRLEKLNDLRKAKAISEDEFKKEKKKILNN